MPGKLENLTRRARTFNLTTRIAPIRALFDRREDQKDGTAKVVSRRVVYPDSISLLARGSTADDLHDGVPLCPEVAKAITKGEVRWVPTPEKPKKAKPPSDAKAEPEEEPRPRQRPAAATR
jgi:hypothetical protein